MGSRSDDFAETLIGRFGSISGIINASPDALREALKQDPSVADAVIACRELIRISTLEELVSERVSPLNPAFRDYLIAELDNPAEERLQAIYLDRDDRFIRDERVSQGSRDSLSVRLRYLLHRALDLGAFGLIVAHNHPSGSATPSTMDRDATERLRQLTASLDIKLVDHCIVARGCVFSMAQNKLI
ncbi:JAB domain-containing protein [Alteraurantiacibacter buctensis]|uniref:MPN domain-containing protein n=1 Tax=Alteraurantiacibacter buctensis TaxID=1503981 RepID=A0A844YXX4_9SPHN|nr:JAB domain-containing protein [Alteraurantiacibacter buctensis]MXO71876.1 hypothetical protein [Alteraurantiacibacter buctensis]